MSLVSLLRDRFGRWALRRSCAHRAADSSRPPDTSCSALGFVHFLPHPRFRTPRRSPVEWNEHLVSFRFRIVLEVVGARLEGRWSTINLEGEEPAPRFQASACEVLWWTTVMREITRCYDRGSLPHFGLYLPRHSSKTTHTKAWWWSEA